VPVAALQGQVRAQRTGFLADGAACSVLRCLRVQRSIQAGLGNAVVLGRVVLRQIPFLRDLCPRTSRLGRGRARWQCRRLSDRLRRVAAAAGHSRRRHRRLRRHRRQRRRRQQQPAAAAPAAAPAAVRGLVAGPVARPCAPARAALCAAAGRARLRPERIQIRILIRTRIRARVRNSPGAR
jgi:hypothetical protein